MPEKKIIKLKSRPCKFCTSRFTPERTQDKDAVFCTETCRVSFHKGGGTTEEYQKLLAGLVKEMTRAVHATAVDKVIAAETAKLKAEIEKTVGEAINAKFDLAFRKAMDRVNDSFIEEAVEDAFVQVKRKLTERLSGEVARVAGGTE
jgi:hypothetical protein